MKSPSQKYVRETIARHAGRPMAAIHPQLSLETDLDLTPLELVLIATEIEEAAGTLLPVEALASVETVADLMRFFRRSLRPARRTHSLQSVA